MNAVSGELQVMYEDYYSGDELIRKKRELAATTSADMIQKLFGNKLGSVCDVGAGNGNVAQQLADRSMYDALYALEISGSGIEAIKARNLPNLVEVRDFDGYNTGYTDRQFDVSMAIHVVEHVEHERMFLRELGRIAKEVYVEIPLEGGIKGKVNRTYGHINYYTPPYFLNLLETSGLQPTAYEVFPPSQATEMLLYGNTKGGLKYYARSGVRQLVGKKLACNFGSYIMAVRCTSL